MFLGVVVALLFVPAAAHAKGPNGATIDGGELAAPITVSGSAGEGGLHDVIEGSGFMAAAFEEQPDPMLKAPPADDLGPKFVLTWHVPNGTATADVLHQDLYPYAAGGPVTYTEPGQPFMLTQRTHGGWFRSTSSFLVTLTELGLPATRPAVPAPAAAPAPAHVPANGTAWPVLPALVIMSIAAATAVVVAARRRRSRLVAPA
jgi:hypothetical protein